MACAQKCAKFGLVAKTVLAHVAELRTLHPEIARLRAREMINDGLTAPLHPAAEQVYKELGALASCASAQAAASHDAIFGESLWYDEL